MSDTSGPTSSRQFAFYDPETSCWRTWPAISLWGSDEYSATWPRSGMTAGGRAYELPTWAHPTGGSACSSLLPTPAVNDMGRGKTVEAWDEWTEKMRAKHGNGNGHGPSLAIEAARLGDLMLPSAVMLPPTPTAQDGANTAGSSQFERNSHPLNVTATLIGARMPLPSVDGNESLAGQRHHQPSLDATDPG